MAQISGQQNLKVSRQFIQWVQGTNRGIMAHLYQWTSLTGENDYFTDFDMDISYNGITWKSASLRFEGLQRKIAIGTSVDEQTMKIWAAPGDTLFGGAFLEGAQDGLLDGALVVRYRAIWPFVSGQAAADVLLNQPIAVWPLFTGYVSQIVKGGASHIELKVKSALMRLEVNMPRNYYQPGCGWTLYDQFCTVNKASYTQTGTVVAGGTLKYIPVSGGVINPVGGDGIANYAQGRIQFTSGVNEGLLTLIDDNDSGTLVLAYPLDTACAVGDTFTYSAGCAKSHLTCVEKFNNGNNFRGFDLVPPIMVST